MYFILVLLTRKCTFKRHYLQLYECLFANESNSESVCFFFCHPAHYFTLALSFSRHYWVVSVLYRKKRKNHFLCSCENTRSTNAFLLCIKNMYLLISGVEPTFNSYNIYFSPLNIFLFNFTKSVLCRITCVLCSVTILFAVRFFLIIPNICVFFAFFCDKAKRPS